MRGSVGQKVDHLNRKPVLFANDTLYLGPNPQIITKTDLNTWNKHSARCFISYKIWS